MLAVTAKKYWIELKIKPTQTTTMEIPGKVTQGYQIASGLAADSPYPAGSIGLQMPFFKKLGLDLSGCYAATLNIDISPMQFKVIDADYQFNALNWTAGVTEDFSLDPCQLSYRGQSYHGFIYYPYPQSKPAHFQPNCILEVIAPKIPLLGYGKKLAIRINPAHIQILMNGEF